MSRLARAMALATAALAAVTRSGSKVEMIPDGVGLARARRQLRGEEVMGSRNAQHKFNQLQYGASSRRDAAVLELGERHPVALELRRLLVSHQPLQYEYVPRHEGMLFEPEHLTPPPLISLRDSLARGPELAGPRWGISDRAGAGAGFVRAPPRAWAGWFLDGGAIGVLDR